MAPAILAHPSWARSVYYQQMAERFGGIAAPRNFRGSIQCRIWTIAQAGPRPIGFDMLTPRSNWVEKRHRAGPGIPATREYGLQCHDVPGGRELHHGRVRQRPDDPQPAALPIPAAGSALPAATSVITACQWRPTRLISPALRTISVSNRDDHGHDL